MQQFRHLFAALMACPSLRPKLTSCQFFLLLSTGRRGITSLLILGTSANSSLSTRSRAVFLKLRGGWIMPSESPSLLRYLCMAQAAFLPPVIDWMAILGPVTISPDEKIWGRLVCMVSSLITRVPRRGGSHLV